MISSRFSTFLLKKVVKVVGKESIGHPNSIKTISVIWLSSSSGKTFLLQKKPYILNNPPENIDGGVDEFAELRALLMIESGVSATRWSFVAFDKYGKFCVV